MEETVSEISDSLDALRRRHVSKTHRAVSDIRCHPAKVIIVFEDTLAPQRDVLLKLPAVSASWLLKLDRGFTIRRPDDALC